MAPGHARTGRAGSIGDAGSAGDAAPISRRQRLRDQLTAEVIATARRQLADGGPGSVSWRGIAREVGVNPASLYTYFDSLDDLVTAVITSSFARLGAAVGEAAVDIADREPTERIVACAHAYRAWAIEHPAEFNLIFTDRIPGYEAPPGGPTVEAQTAIFGPFVTALDDLTDGVATGDPETPSLPPEHLALWSMMHGFVMLEINHHLSFIEDRERSFDVGLRQSIGALARSG